MFVCVCVCVHVLCVFVYLCVYVCRCVCVCIWKLVQGMVGGLAGIGSFVRNFHIGFDHDYECH